MSSASQPCTAAPGAARWLAAAAGVAFAAWLYGWRVIDPSSVQWLLHGDPAQHYIGSVFYRSEAWAWPPGKISRFGDTPTSVVFTDSIPLAAFAAKLLGSVGIWPAHWQYFGLWMLACHGLQGWFAARLLQAMGVQAGWALVCGSIFFIAAPPLLLRAYGHEALMAHFLVLAALALGLARTPAQAGYPQGRPAWPWRAWIMYCAVAVLVHPYLALMVAMLGMAAAAHAWRTGAVSMRLLLQAAVAAAVLPGLAALAGYWVGQGERSAAGFGLYSANLLTWIDPMNWRAFSEQHQRMAPYIAEWSTLLPAQQQATAGQYEGFAYMGAGMLLLMAAALCWVGWQAGVGWLRGAQARATSSGAQAFPALPVGLWVATGVLALAAVSSTVTLGANTLLRVPLPDTVAALAGVFRASGRLVWPLTYLVMALTIASLARAAQMPLHGALPASRKATRRALAIAAVLLLGLATQLIDAQAKWGELRARFRLGPPGMATPLVDPQWPAWLARCPHMHMVSVQHDPAGWEAPALLAALHGARFTPAPTARAAVMTAEQRRALAMQLIRGGWAPGTLYLVHPSALGLMQQARLPVYMQARQVEGLWVVSERHCTDR
ncbi:MAG: hypothetical protein RL014_2735 [Pseudomonadota bacterium]